MKKKKIDQRTKDGLSLKRCQECKDWLSTFEKKLETSFAHGVNVEHGMLITEVK